MSYIKVRKERKGNDKLAKNLNFFNEENFLGVDRIKKKRNEKEVKEEEEKILNYYRRNFFNIPISLIQRQRHNAL